MGFKPRQDGRPNFKGIGVSFGSLHGRAKLTEQLVLELRAQWSVDRYRQGFLERWARKHGVDYATAYRALVGETWTHVSGEAKAHKVPAKAEAAAKREAKKRKGKGRR